MLLVAAILTATVLAIFGFPFRYYRCWLSWSPIGANSGILLYLGLAGAGAGFIGWFTASAAQADLGPNEIIGGILCGAAGTMAIRADFRTQRARPSKPLQEASSLLGKGIEWTTTALEDTTRTRAKKWLDRLDNRSLAAVAWDVVHEIEGAPAQDIPPATRRTLLKRINDALDAAIDEHRQEEGRSRLVHFCAEHFATRHSVKPTLRQPAPSA